MIEYVVIIVYPLISVNSRPSETQWILDFIFVISGYYLWIKMSFINEDVIGSYYGIYGSQDDDVIAHTTQSDRSILSIGINGIDCKLY